MCMKMNELRDKTEQELHILLRTTRDALRSLRFKTALKELKDVREIREKRLMISRILTLLSQKKKN